MLNTFTQLKGKEVNSGGSYQHFGFKYWAENPELPSLPSSTVSPSGVKAALNFNNGTLTEQM